MNPQKPATACTVSFRADGQCWAHTTAAYGPHEAVRKAWAWFYSDNWKGVRPNRETVFELITPTNLRRRVLAARALDTHPQQAPLFTAKSEPFDVR